MVGGRRNCLGEGFSRFWFDKEPRPALGVKDRRKELEKGTGGKRM